MRLVVAILLCSVHALAAQSAPQLRLGPARATLAEEFTSLTGVRELRDGRVLVSDGGEQRIVAADFVTGRVTQVGKRGQGPLEYPRAQRVWPVKGDTGILFDPPERWVIFVGAEITGTLAPDAPAVRITRPIVRGVDTLGQVLTALPLPPPPPGGAATNDSVPLILVKRNPARADTIARLRMLTPRVTSVRNSDGFVSFSLPAMAMWEDATHAPDGWTAVVRIEPYRVDWRPPSGAWIRGAALPLVNVPVTEREKRFFLDRNPGPRGSRPRTPESITDWPEVLPAFRSPTPLFTTPDGRLLISKMPSADRPEARYDIVNRRGQLEAQLVLSALEKVVGFGATSVYVVESDSDGVQRLRRHAWPVIRRI